MDSSQAITYVGFWKRWSIGLIDFMFCYSFIIITFIFMMSGAPEILISAFLYMAWMPIAAELYLYFAEGRSVGHKVFRTKIVSVKTLQKPSSGALIGRPLAKILSVICLYLGFIWVAFDKKKQGWHDKISGTCVVSVSTPVRPMSVILVNIILTPIIIAMQFFLELVQQSS